MADDEILQKEDRNCVKRKLSVVGDVFHFLFDCPTCTHYRTRFVPRKFLQTPLTLLFLSSTKQKEREREGEEEEILAGSKVVWGTEIT